MEAKLFCALKSMSKDFFVTADTLKTLKPHNSLINNIKSNIETQGFAVIQVLEKSEVINILQDFEAWIETNNISKTIGIIKNNGIGHADFVNKIRSNDQIKKIFANLNNTTPKNLLHAFDGAYYYRPQSHTQYQLWPHRDQSPQNNNHMTYQGLVNLTSTNSKGSGSIVVWPKTHKLRHPNAPLTLYNYFRIYEPTSRITKESARRLIIPPGALVLWDSRLIHCNCIPLYPNQDTRAVIYVCMVNKNRASPEILKQLAECKKNKWTTSHNPLDFTIN